MDNYLQNFIPRVEEIKEILFRPQSPEEVTITDARKLTSFFYDFEETNKLIFEAEEMARQSLDELERQFSILSNAIEPILSADLSIWEKVNFEELVNFHLKRKPDPSDALYYVSFFDMAFIEVLIGKLNQIVEAVTRDIERLRRKGKI